MLVTTDAIVLRSMRYGDTSRIVTLYTRALGKVGVIAKGARKPTGRAGVPRFGAALDVLSFSQVVLYVKEQRELQLLSQADLLRQFRGVIDDPARLMAGCAMLEFVNGSVQAGEHHAELFDLLLVSLERLESRAEHYETGLARFLLRLASTLGFALDTQHCLECRAPLAVLDEGVYRFSASYGGMYCPRCAVGPGVRVEPGTAALLAVLGGPDSGGAEARETTPVSRQGILQVLERHLGEHIPGIRTVRSLHLMYMFGS